MMSSDLYGTCSYCFYGTCPISQLEVGTSEKNCSDVRVICLDTLLYVDGIFTVSVIPFIHCGMYIPLSDDKHRKVRERFFFSNGWEKNFFGLNLSWTELVLGLNFVLD